MVWASHTWRRATAGAVLRSSGTASKSRASRPNGIGPFARHCDLADDATGSDATHVDYTNEVSADDWRLLGASAWEKYHAFACALKATAANVSLVGARVYRYGPGDAAHAQDAGGATSAATAHSKDAGCPRATDAGPLIIGS